MSATALERFSRLCYDWDRHPEAAFVSNCCSGGGRTCSCDGCRASFTGNALTARNGDELLPLPGERGYLDGAARPTARKLAANVRHKQEDDWPVSEASASMRDVPDPRGVSREQLEAMYDAHADAAMTFNSELEDLPLPVMNWRDGEKDDDDEEEDGQAFDRFASEKKKGMTGNRRRASGNLTANDRHGNELLDLSPMQW